MLPTSNFWIYWQLSTWSITIIAFSAYKRHMASMGMSCAGFDHTLAVASSPFNAEAPAQTRL
jgi:hypothetical protein